MELLQCSCEPHFYADSPWICSYSLVPGFLKLVVQWHPYYHRHRPNPPSFYDIATVSDVLLKNRLWMCWDSVCTHFDNITCTPGLYAELCLISIRLFNNVGKCTVVESGSRILGFTASPETWAAHTSWISTVVKLFLQDWQMNFRSRRRSEVMTWRSSAAVMMANVDIFTFGKGSTLQGKNTHWWCHPYEMTEWDKHSHLTDVLISALLFLMHQNHMEETKCIEKVWHKEIQCGTESTVKCQDLGFVPIRLRSLLEVRFG